MSRKIPGSAIVPGSITLTQIAGGLNDTTNAAYAQANTARTTANDAYGQANTARSEANTTFATINTTFGTVNTSLSTINTNYQAAYAQANNARSDANTTFATVNTTFGTINTNYQAAYAQANTARDTANNAYNNSNTKLSTSGGSISGDLAITGNLTVQGNATTINVTNLSVNDSMILLSTNAVGDSNDIGFIGHFDRDATATHAGLIRKATENRFYLFDNYEVEPTNNVIDVAGNNFRVGNLRLGIINANSYVTSAGMDVTGQANAAYGQANTARSDANTTFATVNTTFATINTTTATMNTATSNRVLKAGDTMTGQLNISSGGLLVSGNCNFDSGTLFVNSVGDTVGIGTTSNPGFKLDILGGASSQLRITGGEADFWLTSTGANSTWRILGSTGGDTKLFRIYDNDNGADRITINNSGSVGIGTANPALNSGGKGLDVVNATYTQLRVRSTGAAQSAGIEFQPTTGNTWEVQAASDGNFFVYDRTQSSYRLLINSLGNIGVGTIIPSAELHIYKSTGPTINLQAGSSGTKGFKITKGDSGTAYLLNQDASELILGTNNTSRLVISGQGLVGIGTATIPRRLTVQATGTGNYEMVVGAGQTVSQNATLDVICTHDSLAFQVWDDNNLTTPKFVVERGGDVGIGTTNPEYKLDVNGNMRITTGLAMSAATSSLYNNDGTLSFYATNNGVYLNGAGPNGWLRLNGSGAENYRNCIDIYGSGSDYMLFRAANAEKMRINSTGVGIGTASPSYPLHVWNYNNPTTLCIQRTTVPTMITDAQIAGSTASSTWSVNIQDTSNGSQTWGSPINGAYPTGAIQLQSAAGTGTSIAFWTSTGSTSPTQRMTITPSGYVTKPNQPAFSVYQTGGAVKNGTMTYNQTILNRGSHMNNSNGRFTAPVAGAYYFSFMCFQESGTSGVITGRFDINGGSSIVRFYQDDSDTGYGPHVTLAAVLSLNAGDYVTVNITAGQAHGNEDCFFSGYLIG